MNPKHMRLSSTPKNQRDFKHMKYVHYKRKLQFFEKSLAIQERDTNNKWDANNNLIHLVVNLNEEFSKEKIET